MTSSKRNRAAGAGRGAASRKVNKKAGQSFNTASPAGQSGGGNRHQRRAAAARERNIKRNSALYKSYIRHLPQVQIDAPFEPGTVGFTVFHHDERCRLHETNNLADCNCNVVVTRHVVPARPS